MSWKSFYAYVLAGGILVLVGTSLLGLRSLGHHEGTWGIPSTTRQRERALPLARSAATSTPAASTRSPPSAERTDASTSPHLALGVPQATGPSDDHLVVRHGYAIGYSPRRHGPAWAAWRLQRSDFGGQPRHRGHFLTDTSLSPAWGYQVTHDDYRGTGYQRGHLVPSDERTSSAAANEETFLLSNVVPMRGAVNDGPWRGLEALCRTLAQHDGRQLAVFAGPLYREDPTTIGHEVPVPDAYWKIVVVQDPGQGAADVTDATRVLAVIVPNEEGARGRPWATYQTTLADVERRSAHRLLTEVNAETRLHLEAKSATP